MKKLSTINIAIIGTGVIGGSLGLAIKQSIPNAVVTGYDESGQLASALRREAVDFGSATVESAVHDADIIFLCTPVQTILELIPVVSRHCKKSAIITDVGSTKQSIVLKAKKFFAAAGIFVGGHPMAGSEGKGIEYADPLLFQNATYVLCADGPLKKNIRPLTAILHSIGARILFLDAKDHDRIAATISHLPQLIAVGMMNMAGKKNSVHQAYLQLAAGGFRDITRIASSPYGMWKDILAHNSADIRTVIKEFTILLSAFEKDLRTAEGQKAFSARFKDAKELRDAIPKNSKGFLHPLHEVYVSVDDKPGVLSLMTTALFRAKISIKDIELLKIRDGRGGTFRLSFETKKEADTAVTVLQKKHFKTL
ncbi:MAG: prephenate dehydrogenase/arogenate dehydrogenase family protein [Bacteroidota bacterium]